MRWGHYRQHDNLVENGGDSKEGKHTADFSISTVQANIAEFICELVN